MSAFIVSREMIDFIVNQSAIMSDGRGTSKDELTRIGQMLWNENIRSVHCRYPNDDIEKLPASRGDYPFKYDNKGSKPQYAPLALALIKAVECYQYQSCECSDWRDSAAKSFTDRLIRRAIRFIPGYEDASYFAHCRD